MPTLGILSELALSADGSVLAVGARDGYWDEGLPSPGFVQMFAETGAGWEPTARLVAPDGVWDDRFGISVALSGDGGTLVVGAVPPAPDQPSRAGVAYVFEDEGAGWGLEGRIESPSYFGFGWESTISEDGSRLLVQGYDQDPGSVLVHGVVYAYARDGSTWDLEARFEGDEEDVSFGGALGLDADGSTGVIGSYQADLYRGAAIVVRRTGSVWTRGEALSNPGLGPNSALGVSVAIGGRTIAAGATRGVGSASLFYAPDGFGVVADPVDQAGHPFAPVAFTATAAGADSIATQWQTSADAGLTWGDVPGATDPRLSFTPTLADSGRLYRAVFTDGDGATVVTRPATLTVLAATPIVTIAAAPSRFNEEAVFTIVVSATGEEPAPVGGSVEFAIGSFRTTAAVVDGVATVRAPALTLRPGVAIATADYSGDAPDMDPGATSLDYNVLKGAATIRLSVDPAAPSYGQAIDVVAAIDYGGADPGDAPRPTGYVQFAQPGRDLGLGPVVEAGGDVTAGVEASFFGLAGNVVTARYLGDDLYEPSAIVTTTFDQTPAATILVGAAAPTTFGEPVHFRAKVGSDSTAPPTGTIVATVLDSFGGTFRYEQAVGAGGVADFVFDGMRAGRLYVTLDYSDPDGRFMPSRDSETVDVARAPTSIVMSSSTELAAPGGLIRFTATVVSAITGAPVGSGGVTFVANGVVLDSVSIDPAGEASLWTRQLADVGSYAIVGMYGGSEDYLGSDSAVFVQHVGPSPALLRPTTTTTLTTSASTSTAGDRVAFTATVDSPNGGPTWGMVDFTIGGVIVATVPVQPDGRATLETSALVSGVYTVSASFRGSDYYQSSASPSLTQTVLPGATTPTTTNTRLESSGSPSLVGDSIVLTASVWAPDGGPRPTSGVVRFYVGLQAEREVAVDASGQAVLPIYSFIPGEYLVTAVYLGADGHQPSQSQHLVQVVSPRPSGAGATIVEVPAGPAMPVEPAAPAEPVGPAPALTRREQALARLRARREAVAAARAERLARLAHRRPPAARMR
ncbi:MAG: hypothetical protein BGO49_08865 [Planctomycetales bacterium 71-10]|nr:MAG: hypothetical protein BGO49_08865 [Planctomycetales bacterium 71-10]